jgi:hypothetical protein
MGSRLLSAAAILLSFVLSTRAHRRARPGVYPFVSMPCRVLLAALTIPLCLQATSPRARVLPDPRGYVSYRIASPIVIDGRLDDAAWRNAPWTDLFVDIEGDLRPAPTLDTRVKMLWDAEYFYVGASLVEPHLWATLTAHDSVIFADNDFEMFIDPNGDNHEYYEFEINGLGTGWDLLLPKPYKDDGKAVNGWDIHGLKSAVFLDGTLNDARDRDRGWSVELAIPWAALGELARRPAPPRDGDQWRVNFSRVQWPIEVVGSAYRKPAGAREHNWVWSPQHVVDMHRPEWWGYVQFSTAAPGNARFLPDPALPARRWLHDVYYAQRDFRKIHGRWAATFAELGISSTPDAVMAEPAMEVAASLYEVSIVLRGPDATARRWHIRQDALVWSTPQ